METRKKLAARIAALRSALRITQEEAALRSGLDTSYVGLIERCERNPSYDTLTKLASGLGVTLKGLFDFEGMQGRLPLKSQEEELLGWFREAGEHDKNVLIATVKAMVEWERLEKKGI